MIIGINVSSLNLIVINRWKVFSWVLQRGHSTTSLRGVINCHRQVALWRPSIQRWTTTDMIHEASRSHLHYPATAPVSSESTWISMNLATNNHHTSENWGKGLQGQGSKAKIIGRPKLLLLLRDNHYRVTVRPFSVPCGAAIDTDRRSGVLAHFSCRAAICTADRNLSNPTSTVCARYITVGV